MKRYLKTTAWSIAALCLTLSSLWAQETPSTQPLLKRGATVKIPEGKGKFDFLEVDAAHRRLLASHEKDGTADFIDLNSKTLITRIKLGPAVDMALDTKSDRYYISGSDEKKVIVVDAATLKKVDEIPTPGELDAIMYEPKNDRIYVTHDNGTHVWVIDPNTDKVAAAVAIPGAPEYLVYDSTADRIYLNIKTSDEIVAIDPATNTVVDRWSIKPATGPHGLAFDPATGRLFSAGKNGLLAVIDSKTGKRIAFVEIAKGVDQNVFDPSTRRVYCACTGKISVIQETDLGVKFLGNVPTTGAGKNIAIDPQTHALWTTFTDGKDAYAQEWIQP